MKKLLAFILILIMMLSSCARASKDDKVIIPADTEAEQDNVTDDNEEPEQSTWTVNGYGNVIGKGEGCLYVHISGVFYKVNGQGLDTFCTGDMVRVNGKAQQISNTLNYNGYDITVEVFNASVAIGEVDGHGEGAKPVIYLYPERTTDVTVSIDLDGEFTCLYPEYDGKWQVRARPDGTLTDKKGREYYCLYFECINGKDLVPDKNVGFMVKGEDTAEFLRDKALELGLNEREANEFIIYWLPQMQNNPYNYVYFAIDEYKDMAKLNMSPAADTQIRFMMMWQALDTPYEVREQKLPDTPQRHGFTVVEWGGTEIK